jgi:hypothetical protein
MDGMSERSEEIPDQQQVVVPALERTADRAPEALRPGNKQAAAKMGRLPIGILCALSSVLCGCGQIILPVSTSTACSTSSKPAANCGPNGFTLVGQSGDVRVGQGYASSNPPTNVPGDYFFDTVTLYLSTNYNSLDPAASTNMQIVPGTNHMGDGEFYNGNLYGVIEHWNGCSKSSGPIYIDIFDSTTLQIVQTSEISLYQSEASGITIDPDTSEAIVSNFCDPTKLYVYDMSTWTLSRTIPLAITCNGIQGVAYKEGFVYIATNGGLLYSLRLSDNLMRLLLTAPMPGEYEGIDFNTSELRWLLNHPDGTHVLYRYLPN